MLALNGEPNTMNKRKKLFIPLLITFLALLIIYLAHATQYPNDDSVWLHNLDVNPEKSKVLSDTELSTRAIKAMEAEGLTTVEQLLRIRRNMNAKNFELYISNLRNIGTLTKNEIILFVQKKLNENQPSLLRNHAKFPKRALIPLSRYENIMTLDELISKRLTMSSKEFHKWLMLIPNLGSKTTNDIEVFLYTLKPSCDQFLNQQ